MPEHKKWRLICLAVQLAPDCDNILPITCLFCVLLNIHILVIIPFPNKNTPNMKEKGKIKCYAVRAV